MRVRKKFINDDEVRDSFDYYVLTVVVRRLRTVYFRYGHREIKNAIPIFCGSV